MISIKNVTLPNKPLNNFELEDAAKDIANFHGHALSVLSLIKKSMKKSMSTVKAREFPEFGEHQLCVIANR